MFWIGLIVGIVVGLAIGAVGMWKLLNSVVWLPW